MTGIRRNSDGTGLRLAQKPKEPSFALSHHSEELSEWNRKVFFLFLASFLSVRLRPSVI